MSQETVRVENPTPEQEQLMEALMGFQRLELMLSGPIDIRFLPDDRIDRRRLEKVRIRLIDETHVLSAAVKTELLRSGDNVRVE